MQPCTIFLDDRWCVVLWIEAHCHQPYCMLEVLSFYGGLQLLVAAPQCGAQTRAARVNKIHDDHAMISRVEHTAPRPLLIDADQFRDSDRCVSHRSAAGALRREHREASCQAGESEYAR